VQNDQLDVGYKQAIATSKNAPLEKKLPEMDEKI
jgi:hypothetical protein